MPIQELIDSRVEFATRGSEFATRGSSRQLDFPTRMPTRRKLGSSFGRLAARVFGEFAGSLLVSGSLPVATLPILKLLKRMDVVIPQKRKYPIMLGYN